MKNLTFNKIISLIITVVILLVIIPSDSFPEEKKNLTETVNVIDFEVPVRVFFKKKLVDNLTKKDFLLYEGGKLQNINGFYIIKKRIKAEKSFQTEGEDSHGKGRYFVLVFRITEFNDSMKTGLKFMFDKVLKKSDQLMLFINEKTFFIHNLRKLKAVEKKVENVLRKESVRAKQRLSVVLDKIDTELSYTKFRQIISSPYGQPAQDVINFLEKYILIWEDYRDTYLTPSMDDYYNFARYLQKIDKEKWVINFYQIEMFPKLKNSGEMMRSIRSLISELQTSSRGEDVFHSRVISNLLMKISIALNAATEFPADEISKLFYKVNTVFHSIFIRTSKTVLSQDIEYKKVSSNLENSFREITEKTGGTLISSGNISKSVQKLTEKEDILYMLTYSPDQGKKVGKIKIETKNRNYKIVFDNNIRDKYIKRYFQKKEMLKPSVKIDRVNLVGKNLKIKITDYFFRMENGKKYGKLRIHVKVSNQAGENFCDQRKTIIAEKKSFSVSLGLKNLVPDEYGVLVEVHDILTEKEDMKYIKTEYK